MKTRIVKCDLCGKDDSTVVWDKTKRFKDGILLGKVIKDKDGNIIHGINVVCNNCGLIYIREQMTPDTLDYFYKNDYRKLYGDSTQASKNHAMNAIMLLSQLQKTYNIKDLLDIGCYTGEFVKSVNDLNIKADGIDFDTMGNETLIKGNFMDYNFYKKYDCITLFNSLEHMLSPTEALDRIHELLNDGGYVMLSVPNILGLSLSTVPDAFLSNAHTYTFNDITLKKLLSKVGFKILFSTNIIESIGTKLYVFAQKTDTVKGEVDKNNVNAEVYKAHLESMDCFLRCTLAIQGGH